MYNSLIVQYSLWSAPIFIKTQNNFLKNCRKVMQVFTEMERENVHIGNIYIDSLFTGKH